MTETVDLLIQGGTCVLPEGLVEADIALSQGKIKAIGSKLSVSAAQTISARGLHVFPGFIDTQVHFREPGFEYKEDLESGTRGAVLGGVTTVFEMPNTKPQTTTPEALQDKLDRAKGRCWSNYAFFMGGTPENAHLMGELERLPGCCGVKVFMGSSTGGLLIEDDETLRQVLSHGRRRVAIHAEDEPRLRERVTIAKTKETPTAHPDWRDAETAFLATRRVVALAYETGRPIHVLHVTTADEIRFLGQHKAVATVEVTPQHLTLFAPDCYERLGNYAQMNPPIRDIHHQAGLWYGIEHGIVDVLGSDHAPHTKEEKDRPYPKSPAGMPGVQTMVPLMLTHMNAGRLSLSRLVDLLCEGPIRLFGIQGKGRLVEGYDADLTLVDLKAQRLISHEWMATKTGWTPFDQFPAVGWPMYTIVGGHVVVADEQLTASPAGQPVRFN